MPEPTPEEVLQYLDERAKWTPAYSDDVMDQHGKMARAAARLIREGSDAVPREVALRACEVSGSAAYVSGKSDARANIFTTPDHKRLAIIAIAGAEMEAENAALAAAEREAKKP